MTDTWFDELAEFLRIPSVSADPGARRRTSCARGSGCASSSAAPAASASSSTGRASRSRSARSARRATRTARRRSSATGTSTFSRRSRSTLWESPPFEPEIRDGYLYGRGAVDDKGQLYMLLAAARELAQAGELPVNVRFCCDGEEETGGHSIVDYLAADERGADAAIIFDSGMIRRGLPAFNVATRGLVYFHLTLRTGERDLHSGMYGGAALNAVHALVRTLDALLARDGRLVEPLRKGIVAPTEEELAGWRELPAGAGELADQGARPTDPAAAERVLPAHVRRARARRERRRRRVAAPPEDGASGRGRGEPVDPPRAGPERRGDRARGRATAARGRARGGGARDRALVVVAAGPRPAGLAGRSSSGSTAFERVARRPSRARSARAGRSRSSPRSPTGASRRSSRASSLPDSNVHSPNERLRRRVHPARHRSRNRALQRACAAPALRSRPRRLHGAASRRPRATVKRDAVDEEAAGRDRCG